MPYAEKLPSSYISIHAPRMGSDYAEAIRLGIVNISIHAPRMGSDNITNMHRPIGRYFNPRPPHGERRYPGIILYVLLQFQSTPPAWGATILLVPLILMKIHFNPRPPHGERRLRFLMRTAPLVFQSTPPAWGATAKT